jgi:hypothetical protein
MDWMFRHRYFAALFSAAFLVFVGFVIVQNRSAVGPSSSNSIDVNGVIQADNPAAPIPSTAAPARPAAVDVPYTKVTQPDNPNATAANVPQNDGFDWNSFIASLSNAATQMATGATSSEPDNGISDAYAFVPSGLISPPTEKPLNSLTPSQRDLYGWGTDVGSVIQSYESAHPNQVAILTDYMQDRQNPDKIAAMKQLGADLEGVGDSINNVNNPPPQMATAGAGLAAAYKDIGQKLAIIPDAKGDDATVKAILTYDSAAEAFVQKYVAVALVFQANGVTFSQDTPGGVFMFPGN